MAVAELPPITARLLPFYVGEVGPAGNGIYEAYYRVGQKAQDLHFRILDESGQEMKALRMKKIREVVSTASINMQEYAPGLYTLVVSNGKGEFRRPFMVEGP